MRLPVPAPRRYESRITNNVIFSLDALAAELGNVVRILEGDRVV
jgi:hypothetical protein